MRFVIGIITGAVLILLLAEVAGTAEHGWGQRVPELLDELAEAAGDALALPPRPTAAEPAAGRGPGPLAAAGSEPASEPIVRPPDPLNDPPAQAREVAVAVAAASPAASPAAFGEAAAGASPAVDEGPAVVDEDAQRLVAELFAAPASSPDAAASPLALAAAGAEPHPQSSQTVWVPFRSEMSASGFAQRLSESLDHPFRVERQGPGRYQVVFVYRDEPQRRALLDEAAAATGLPL